MGLGVYLWVEGGVLNNSLSSLGIRGRVYGFGFGVWGFKFRILVLGLVMYLWVEGGILVVYRQTNLQGGVGGKGVGLRVWCVVCRV